jgi:UDP-N-acetylglucosamine transferase subunit ALG13
VARNIAAAARAARELRPGTVVSAGAGATVAFCLAARLLGARLVFVETMARVVDRSRTGRVLAPLADRVLVQWPELLELYPRAELCRPALLEGRPEDLAPPGRGTLVAVGTHAAPFQRLLDLADAGIDAGLLPTPVVAQVGPGHMRSATRSTARMAPAELDAAVRASELVLCHAGSGLVSQAVRAGRTPLLLARRREHGEHVDDHQVATAAKLEELGYAVSLERHELADAIDLARHAPPPAPLGASMTELLAAAVSLR